MEEFFWHGMPNDPWHPEVPVRGGIQAVGLTNVIPLDVCSPNWMAVEVWLAAMPDESKRRPCVVLSADWLNRYALDVMVVPVTEAAGKVSEHLKFERSGTPAGIGQGHR